MKMSDKWILDLTRHAFQNGLFGKSMLKFLMGKHMT